MNVMWGVSSSWPFVSPETMESSCRSTSSFESLSQEVGCPAHGSAAMHGSRWLDWRLKCLLNPLPFRFLISKHFFCLKMSRECEWNGIFSLIKRAYYLLIPFSVRKLYNKSAHTRCVSDENQSCSTGFLRLSECAVTRFWQDFMSETPFVHHQSRVCIKSNGTVFSLALFLLLKFLCHCNLLSISIILSSTLFLNRKTHCLPSNNVMWSCSSSLFWVIFTITFIIIDIFIITFSSNTRAHPDSIILPSNNDKFWEFHTDNLCHVCVHLRDCLSGCLSIWWEHYPFL